MAAVRPHPVRRFIAVFLSVLLVASSGCSGFFTPRDDDDGTGGTARFAYVANFNGGGAGTISTFSVNSSTGALTSTGSAVSTGTGGDGPAALVVAQGKFLYSANDEGSVSAFTIDANTGALSTISGSPFVAGIGASALATNAAGTFLYVANTGALTISVYSINSSTGALSAVALAVPTQGAAAGVAVHPNGKFLYAAEDADGIEVFTINTDGSLTFSELEPPYIGGAPQAVVISSGGTLLFAADGIGGVEVYDVNTTSGALSKGSRSSAFGAGNDPVAITTDSAGRFVYTANQTSSNVSGFAILSGGSLTALSGSPYGVGTNSAPIAVRLDPSEKFLYTANFNGNPGISIFTLDTGVQGKLNSSGSATAGTNPAGIAFR
jgi:6-phosphogluconolactonase